MKIGELSAASATAVETIRYYEREGLLPAPARSGGNFRIYEARHLDRLQFIRYCRGLDMSLDEVRVLLHARDTPGADCGDVNAVLDEHLRHVTTRIRELRQLERQLKDLRQRCQVAQTTECCGILAGLDEAAQGVPEASTSGRHLRSVHGLSA